MSDKQPRRTVAQFFFFGIVGSIGFVVDTAVLYAVFLSFSLNLYVSRLISYACAATTTWYLNRKMTFRSASSQVYREWFLFAVTNLGGGLLNYGVFAGLVSTFAFVAENPVVGVAAGSLAGMMVNFALSKKLVFNQ